MRLGEFLAPLSPERVKERYGIALACAALAILLRDLLEPLLGHVSFYVTVYMAVTFSALVGGVGPAIATALLGTAGVVYWFVDPRKSFTISDVPEIHQLLGCIIVCAVLVALGETSRQKRLQITISRDLLENRVQERTTALSEALKQRETAEEQLRALTIQLMAIQDDERRRIARDLHDSAGQTLSAMKMTLAGLQQGGSDVNKRERLMDDLNALTDEALKEIRTTSYLLHPPLLDECGLGSAARWFVDGFTKRSGIQIECDIPEEMERLPENVELALFRILQEALTNVHRHSGATRAGVSLRSDASGLTLQVHDNGKGVSEEKLSRLRETNNSTGVGLAGMRERVRELGGKMEIESGAAGTRISFVVLKKKTFQANAGKNSAA